MYQKFFTDTIETKFIKSLIYNTPLPIYDTVSFGDYLLEGVIYIYKTSVIKCTKSGYLSDIFSSTSASFEVIDTYIFGQYYNQLTERYKSKYNYYDSETHRYLGNYLRCIRDIFDVDLMPFYNCFNYKMISDIHLSKWDRSTSTTYDEYTGYEESSDSNYKVIAIPIKFNTPYTIAIDCDQQVLMKSILYGKFGPTKVAAGTKSKYVMDELREDTQIKVSGSSVYSKIVKFDKLQYNHPVVYKISNNTSKYGEEVGYDGNMHPVAQKFQALEKELYLAIQLPSTNNSSITVIEGDYSDTTLGETLVYDSKHIPQISQKDINKFLISQLGLLQLNTKQFYAFSDRLIEYLLSNVIDYIDEIEDNITRIQEYSELRNCTKGVFSVENRLELFKKYITAKDTRKIDINGFVDKDVENFIMKGIDE